MAVTAQTLLRGGMTSLLFYLADLTGMSPVKQDTPLPREALPRGAALAACSEYQSCGLPV